jgi:DNA-binding GntR family transcriptional regulator
LTLRLKGIARGVLGQHKKLLTALKKQDPDGARAILKLHLHKLSDEGTLLLQEFPDYFVSRDGATVFDIIQGETFHPD